MAMTRCFRITSKIQRRIYSTTLMNIMLLCTARHHHHRRLQLSSQYLWMDRLRSHSQLDIAEKRITLRTSWKSISNSLRKTSIIVTQSSGGSADKVNFRASFSWRVTFYAYLVSILAHFHQILSVSELSITGSAVAVERIFSGGRDTISLRRARLQADTIRTLMLVKKRLHLARAKAAR
jgi:hypothetical protein